MSSSRVAQGLVAAGLFIFGTQGATAQSCMGLPDLAVMRRGVSGYGSGQGSERLVLGRLGLAAEKAFGGAQLGYGGLGFDHPKSAVVGGDIGYALSLGSKKTTVCPRVQSLYQLGERRFGVQQHRWMSTGGISLGRSFSVGQSFSFIPFVQANVVHHLYGYAGRYRDSGVGRPATNEFGTEVGLGFGLKFGETFTLRPAVVIPTDWIDSQREPVFSFAASFGLRGKR